MRALLILLVGFWLGAAPALAAPPVSVPVPSEPDALAYAPGHVLWVTHKGSGPLVVTQAPATVLATIPRVHPSSGDVAVSLAATAGGWVLSARDGKQINTGECGCDYFTSQGDLVVRGGYDGAPAGTLVNCVPKAGTDEQPGLLVTAGVSGYLLSGVRCGAPAMVDTIAADGTLAPIAGIEPSLYEGISYAEPFAAVSGTAAGAPKQSSLHVYDTSSGTRRDLPSGGDWNAGLFQVLADGTVLLGDRGAGNVRQGIFSWPPGAATPALLAGPGKVQLGVGGGGRLLYRPNDPVADLAADRARRVGPAPRRRARRRRRPAPVLPRRDHRGVHEQVLHRPRAGDDG